MKYVFLLLLLIPVRGISQCGFEDIIVFDHGITKFDAIKKSKSVKGLNESDRNKSVTVKWEKPEYLSDSVLKDIHYFDVASMQCYKMNRCLYAVYFADDKLYQQKIELEFDVDKFDDYNEIYKKITGLFKMEFDFSKALNITQPGTGIKTGEGFIYADTEGLQEKVKQVKIYNSISYKKDATLGVATSEIEKYSIVIESTDLAGTKLDSRGY